MAIIIAPSINRYPVFFIDSFHYLAYGTTVQVLSTPWDDSRGTGAPWTPFFSLNFGMYA